MSKLPPPDMSALSQRFSSQPADTQTASVPASALPVPSAPPAQTSPDPQINNGVPVVPVQPVHQVHHEAPVRGSAKVKPPQLRPKSAQGEEMVRRTLYLPAEVIDELVRVADEAFFSSRGDVARHVVMAEIIREGLKRSDAVVKRIENS